MNSGTMTGGARRRTITAFFDRREAASEAVERLVQAGFSRETVRLTEGQQSGGQASGGGAKSVPDASMGLLGSLSDLFLPDEDRHAYAEGLSRGGYLVSVSATDQDYERAIDILDDEGTVDMEERASTWRQEGWTGTHAGLSAASGATTSASTGASTSRTGGTDREAIPIVEEQLQVGKREVEHGRVRVRSYVVETPVQEQVTLREEHVHVERRPVDRPLTDADRDAFRDRTIEAEAHGEEAVVSKQTRVKEELVVSKDVEQRTQTVSDTVRHTEVEVEDGRGEVSRTGTTGSTADQGRR